jgi:deazaflavin-dependent oxidoreductase (nitroreductase family)
MTAAVRDRVVRARSAVHRAVFARTRGRVLSSWAGTPVALLETTGRRTGRPRRAIVAALLTDGGCVVVVASDGGAPTHPGWYRNLCANPEVGVVFRGRRMRMRARTAGAEERRTLWPRIAAASPAYGRYQERTAREIPVVVLEPAGR